MSVRVGLDLGSTAIKAVFVKEERLIWQGLVATAPGQEALAEHLIAKGLAESGLDKGDLQNPAVTGYGKGLYAKPGKVIDEISANALGCFTLSGGLARTVINIGGQDVKAICLDDQGRVSDFIMNDKCAAGTGRFFELAARLLDTPLEDFGRLSRQAAGALELNSTCVVFAESEIVSAMARGAGREELIRALHFSVARRVAGLAGRRLAGGGVFLDGGPAQNEGLLEALQEELMIDVQVLPQPQYTVAYGAAVSL